ncbi:hypothetical protein GCM10027062_42800 [Nocardioides hungaricus]
MRHGCGARRAGAECGFDKAGESRHSNDTSLMEATSVWQKSTPGGSTERKPDCGPGRTVAATGRADEQPKHREMTRGVE